MYIAQTAIKNIANITCLLGISISLPSPAQIAKLADRNLLVQTAAKPSNAAQASQRVALVMGNAAYKDAPLLNPVNDARAIASALKEAGFTVIFRENIDQRGMLSALREFGDKLRTGGVGLFYYAGHGMQIKGRNYLIPVGANVEREDEVAYSAVDAQAVLDKMEAAGNGTNIMILDACRNNPFMRNTRNGSAGLAQMDAPTGTLVAFATSPGAVASDGAGQNGLYTQHLLTAMRQPGAKVEDVFKQVRANVRRDSQNKQVPWEVTSLEGDFYFLGGAAKPTSAIPSDLLEAALWDVVKTSSLPIEVRAYLNRYPAGRYAADAKARLAQLQINNSATNTAATALPNASQPDNRPVAAPSSSGITSPQATVGNQEMPKSLQTAFERRTQELLAELSAVPIKPLAVKPAPASNRAGFTVGDRWRYQTVDKFKQEVVGNWGRNIEVINTDGTLKLNGGFVGWNVNGDVNFVRDNKTQRAYEYSPSLKQFPSSTAAGYSEPINYISVRVNEDGTKYTDALSGTFKVLDKEQIKVPAGEFSAYKFEKTGFIISKNLNTNSVSSGKFKEVIWYVPALRNFVAIEYEVRNSYGSIQSFVRHELTSYSIRGADEALAKR